MSEANASKLRADETLFPAKFDLVNNIPDGCLAPRALANREIVADAYRAMSQGNGGALAEIMHPDVVFREAMGLPYGCDVRGLDAALTGVSSMFASWNSVHVELIEVLGGGDLVIAYLNFSAVSRDTGRSYSGPICEVFRFDGDKVVEWYPVYWDTHEVRKVCGLST